MRAAVLVVCLVGCAQDVEFTDCALGEIAGAWKASYVEQSGNCGPLPDAVLILRPGYIEEGCKVNYSDVSEDKCEMQNDVSCQLDNGSELRTVIALTQEGYEVISGQVTYYLEGSCTGTYLMTMRRL